MRFKLIDSNYDAETGISSATIQTKQGIFTATSRLHEEDKDSASKFAGCENAEFKAYIKAHHEKIKRVREAIKLFEDFYNTLSQGKDFHEESFEAKSVRKKIYLLKREKEDLLKVEESMRESFKESLSNREKTLKAIRKKMGKDN